MNNTRHPEIGKADLEKQRSYCSDIRCVLCHVMPMTQAKGTFGGQVGAGVVTSLIARLVIISAAT